VHPQGACYKRRCGQQEMITQSLTKLSNAFERSYSWLANRRFYILGIGLLSMSMRPSLIAIKPDALNASSHPLMGHHPQ
jgi:hypothetical protein